MSGRIVITTFALASTLAGLFGADAVQARTGLPGVKSYTFTMSPQKLRRYCDRIWLGRFWWKKQRYGCDDIPGGEGGKQVDTHEYDIDCHRQQCILRLVPHRAWAAMAAGSQPARDAGSILERATTRACGTFRQPRFRNSHGGRTMDRTTEWPSGPSCAHAEDGPPSFFPSITGSPAVSVRLHARQEGISPHGRQS